MPAQSLATRRRTGAYHPLEEVERVQDLSREGVEGYGEQLRPHLLREIGTALGGLNEIGALRSGGTTVALNDITTNYAQQIGAFAKQATRENIGLGLDTARLQHERSQAKRQRKAGLLKAIGGVLGAGIGFLVGGPPGAVAQAPLPIPAPAGGSEVSDATYNTSDLG
jgi:hypothetical protein